MHDRPMCDFTKSHCILCSKHVVSAKALTAHLRSNHPGQMQEAIALGIQRTRQHTGNLAPCSFCNTNFSKCHLCPVTTQVAVLEMQVATPDDPRNFTCFLCQVVATDRLQLRRHLASQHQFPCFDWTPARDSLADQVTCAHCGSGHHCQEASRPWTRNGDEDVAEKLRLGRIDLLLADAEVRRRLILHCQICIQTFTQACNLSNHLLQYHAELAAPSATFQNLSQTALCP